MSYEDLMCKKSLITLIACYRDWENELMWVGLHMILMIPWAGFLRIQHHTSTRAKGQHGESDTGNAF